MEKKLKKEILGVSSVVNFSLMLSPRCFCRIVQGKRRKTKIVTLIVRDRFKYEIGERKRERETSSNRNMTDCWKMAVENPAIS